MPNHVHGSRVIRAFTLPAIAFNHLLTYKRHYHQLETFADTGRTVTNSEALCNILQDHDSLSRLAGSMGYFPKEFFSALASGELTLVKGAAFGRRAA